jgi:hypothetical protein
MFKKVVWIVGILLVGYLSISLWNKHADMQANGIRTICWQIGKDLIAKTNSPMMPIEPFLRQPLESFLASPAKVEEVKLGDDPKHDSHGWRDAKARLFLTNGRQERLEIRIGQVPGITNFVALGMHAEKINSQH